MEQKKNNFKIVSDKKARIILPNAITLIGVCIGLTSIKFAIDGKFAIAIIAILFAGLMDALDGRIARLIKGTSKIGKELDSLGDVISFGVAPALIMYFWNLQYLDKLGWFVCLIYVVCVALRLARFNINSEDEPSWEDNFSYWIRNVAETLDKDLLNVANSKLEKIIISAALDQTNGKKNEAAILLGLGRNTLAKKNKGTWDLDQRQVIHSPLINSTT